MPLSGCKELVNQFAFYPNQTYEKKLPPEVQERLFTTSDEVQLSSLYLPTIGSDTLLIYFHGNAGNIYHRIPTLLHLQKTGVSVLGVSYRGYGKSAGEPSEEGLYLDGQAALNFAVNDLGLDERNIIIFGRSIGSTVAVDLAQHKNLLGTILVTPLKSGEEQAETMGLGLLTPLVGDAFNNFDKIDKLASPLLIIHGTNDKVVPFSSGKDLFDKATVNKTFVRIEGGKHNDLPSKYSQEYWQPIFEFVANLTE